MQSQSFYRIFWHKLKTDPIPDWAATLAYYFMLSIFPLLIFLLALIPYFQFDLDTIYSFINDYVPEDLADLLSTTILEVISEPQGGLLSFGVLATIWSASNGVNALVRAVNRSYNIEETRNFVKLRLLSILLTFGMIAVIIVTLLLPVFGNVIIQALENYFFLPHETAQILNSLRWIIGIGLMTIVLMLLYSLAPNVKLTAKQVIIGAVTATVGWQVISALFSTYVSNFGNFTATYGSLGGVIILMLWFFLTGVILVIGGEINASLYLQKQNHADEIE
ncbi:YihY/virulence factor BrkB family protein [Alkalihalobacillus sp. MEB130]|uniref:YihY/virulence factor BrkB family protein n=1 Tax=Alkalihalobacillus sp. MEB130 TaxID=2976704 RepID=UPI0028DFAC1B|nr:YihY/virulence factor BrkB family protein [Alkalihalobacillus sp. MEB130]MDT8858603.1 YihY/virulence factor BrkB family protein [Alkalihalobacillus sp. MEB130]